MSEKDSETLPRRGERRVSVTFNNSTGFDLRLHKKDLIDGRFISDPPSTVAGGKSCAWATESTAFLTGTEASVRYRSGSGGAEFYMHWNNRALGPNSYSAAVTYGSEKYGIHHAGTAGNGSALTVTAYERPGPSLASWMADIDGDKFVSQLSIPGTHESCASYSPDGDILGIVICQNLTVSEQLERGVRFLDVRCRATDGVFTSHHGAVYQNLNFGDVLNSSLKFLSAHPSEVIFMRIKQEYSEVSDAEFIKIFRDKYGSYHRYMHLTSDVPRLAEVRGKIVVLSNVMGLPGISWSSLTVQDDYDPSSLLAKIRAISRQFDRSIDNHLSGRKDFFVNFISQQGRPAALTIRQSAEKLNPMVVTMLHEKSAMKGIGVGIVPMDFPNFSDGVIQTIARSNF